MSAAKLVILLLVAQTLLSVAGIAETSLKPAGLWETPKFPINTCAQLTPSILHTDQPTPRLRRARKSVCATILTDTLFLKTYNTRLVVVSVTFLGAAAGLIGSFLLLRKQSLLGDALSHATLPGIGIALPFT